MCRRYRRRSGEWESASPLELRDLWAAWWVALLNCYIGISSWLTAWCLRLKILTTRAQRPQGSRGLDLLKSGDVLYFAFHGIAFLFPARMGICAAGGGYCALHPPAAGYLLDLHHPVSGMGGGPGLYCGRGH